MTKTRMEAFSDGVLAIVITIMVLEMKVPHGSEWSALRPLLPVFVSYVLSFLYVGIYWNNHHHLLQLTDVINGKVLWANLNLLFWLSLVPFTSGWMGENEFAPWPTAMYGFVLLMAGLAWMLLQRCLLKCDKTNQRLRAALGTDIKERISLLLYVSGILLAFVNSWLAILIYLIVAVVWFIPDRRMENAIPIHSSDD